MHVAHPDALLVHVFGEVLGHPLGQHGDQRAVAGRRGGADLADQVVDLGCGPGGSRPAGRSGRSGGSPARRTRRRSRSSSHADGVADTATDCGRIMSHSSNRSGRLSMQDGSRKPYSASVALRRKSPLNMPPICGTVTMAFVGEHQRVVGDVFEQRRRRLAGAAAGQVARIVLDAGAASGGLHHLDVEGGALLQPLRFQQAALAR